MNSFLKLAISNLPDDWESSGSGTIIRPRLVLIDELGASSEPWSRWKYKQWCIPKPKTCTGMDAFMAPAMGQSMDEFIAQYKYLWKEYNAEKYHRLDRKVLMMYTDMRVFLKGYLTEAQFRRENGSKTLMKFIACIYREQVLRDKNDFEDGDYGGIYHLELDLRREPRDRLAIVRGFQGPLQ
jgi:hypothetical protein